MKVEPMPTLLAAACCTSSSSILLLFVSTSCFIMQGAVSAFVPMPSSSSSSSLSSPPIKNAPFIRTSSSSSQPPSSSLSIVKSDESLSERLEAVKNQWLSIKSQGVTNYFIDEIQKAEKIVEQSILDAEKSAEIAIERKFDDLISSTVDGSPPTNQIDAASNAATKIINYASETIVNDLKAMETISEAVSIAAKSDMQAVKDLSLATGDVAETIKQARDTLIDIQEKISNNAVVGETEKILLETSSQAVYKSKEAAKAISQTVNNVVSEDQKSILELTNKGEELVQSMEKMEVVADNAVKDLGSAAATNTVSNAAASSNFETERKVVTVLESTAKEVMSEMRAAENIAESMAKVAQADAAAVSSLESKADDVMAAITSVESAIDTYNNAAATKDTTMDEESKSQSFETLKNVARDAVEKLKADEEKVEIVQQALSNDAKIDEKAVDVLKSADDTIDEIIKVAENVVKDDVDKNTNAVAATTSTSSSSSVDTLQSMNDAAVESVKSVEKAASECTDCAIKAVAKAMEESSSSEVVEKTAVEDKLLVEPAAVSVVPPTTPAVGEAVSVINDKVEKTVETMQDIVMDVALKTETSDVVDVMGTVQAVKAPDAIDIEQSVAFIQTVAEQTATSSESIQQLASATFVVSNQVPLSLASDSLQSMDSSVSASVEAISNAATTFLS